MVRIPMRGKPMFLKADSVEDGDVATILEPPYIVDAEKSKFGKERTVITVQLKRTDETYRWGLNTTSNDRLVQAFSEDGDLWRGQTLKIQKRIENVRGNERHVMYALPSRQQAIGPAEKNFS